MKTKLLGLLAVGIMLPTFSFAQDQTPQVEPLLTTTPDVGAFVKEFSLFSDASVGGEPISRTDATKIFIHYLLTTEGESWFAKRANENMLCSFTDIAGLTQEEQSSIKNACAHGLFKGNHRAFAPKDSLTWAETLAVLSRISEANITEKTPRRQGYYDLALQKEWIQKADLEKMNRKITKENFVNVLYAFHLTTPNQNANEPTETEGAGNLIGGQKDAHGCYLGAGYRWNEEAQECQRSRENNGTGEATEHTVLSGTARKLVSYSGMAVTGEYVLNFQDTNLSTKFCNFINGAYTLSGELMNGTLISTMMACIDPEQEALETAFSLDATKRAIEDDILTLTMKKGATFGWKALPLE